MGLRPGFGMRLQSAGELLARHTPFATIYADWPGGRVRLSAHLGQVDLPAEIPGRVRCLVTDGHDVLVVWDPDGRPGIFPGGGSEPGESIAATASREVLEETGWHLDPATIETVGWIHLESLSAAKPDLPYPHPDSFMTVVAAAPSHAEAGHETWADLDGYVARSAFVPVAELPREIQDDPLSGPYLDHVLRPRRP